MSLKLIKTFILNNAYYGYDWEDVIVEIFLDERDNRMFRRDRLSWCKECAYIDIFNGNFNDTIISNSDQTGYRIEYTGELEYIDIDLLKI